MLVTPRATLEFRASDNVLLYATVGKGVKPGGYSTVTGGGWRGIIQPLVVGCALLAVVLGATTWFLAREQAIVARGDKAIDVRALVGEVERAVFVEMLASGEPIRANGGFR